MAVKYLDNAGTQYLVNKIKAIDGKIPTESQITTMITNALNTYKEGIVTIVESLPQTGEEGKLYLLIDPSDTDVYIVYTWEENAFKRMGSKTFTLTVDSALSSTSTNPVQNKVVKSALDGKANSSHTHGSITNDGKLATASRVVITGTDKKIGVSTVTTTQLGYLSGVTSAIQTQLDGKSPTGHTHTAGDVAGLATVATSGSYNDLSNKPTINNSTITIQKNGSLVGTFTVNGSAKTIDIPVPTKTSDLNNDSNFVDTSNSAVSSGITSAKVTAYDSHVADTDIHVTTADKTKWNNGVSQSYVFRYSSTVLVASSTNSNALLDNTDNLKVGDKVIDSDGVLFSITAIDSVNSTFTVGSALIDLALDANVVHTSGNETVDGDKTFTNSVTFSHGWTFWNNPIVTKGTIPQSTVYPYRLYFGGRGYPNSLFNIDTSVSNTGVQTLILRSAENVVSGDDTRLNITYDPTLSQPRCIRFRGDCVPTTSDTYECGTSSNKWSNVYATNYYYGSNNTEFSNKFVTTDTAQDISANKNFKGLITTQPDSPLWGGTNNTTADITSLALNCFHIEHRSAGTLTDLSGGAWCVAQIGTGCFFFRHNTGTDIRFKHFNTNTVSKICVMSNDNKFISDLCPDTTNSYNLGDSTSKWATINGLEPSSLGMPDLSNGIDISSYITHLDKVVNSYTPSVNGWISIRVKKTSLAHTSLMIYQIGGLLSSCEADEYNISGTNLPVIANKNVEIYIYADALVEAKFYPCQGNV